MRIHKIYFAFLFLSIPLGIWAQIVHDPQPKARKAFYSAVEYWEDNDLDKAVIDLRKAMEIDSLYLDPYLLLADIYFDKGEFDATIDLYSRALAIDPDGPAKVYYLLGSAYLAKDDYEQAINYLEEYLTKDELPEEMRTHTAGKLEIARFRKNAKAHPVPFRPYNLGPGINTEFDEYVNSITLDETRMVFTLTQPDTISRGHLMEGFVMAVKEDTTWVKAGRALPDLYELGNIGAMSLSPDGRFLFFTSCGSSRGIGSCDLFVCGKEGDSWTEPQNLGDVVNTANWESQPCFSADGQTLYFSSARRGGMGGSDIWFTRFRQGVGWSRPENAGPMINTPKEEMAPFIHPDGQTMYFSSKGRPGMGGFDLFITRKDKNGQWQEAENFGWPVNTAADEILIVVSTNGKAAYLSSTMEGGYGGYDIYRFALPAELAPQHVSYLEGHVYDADTKEPLQAELQLLDLKTEDLVVRCESEKENGHYMAALPGGKNYALHISKPGYLFYSENVDLTSVDVPEDPVNKDVYLQPIKEGQRFTLNNIFFDTDEYSLSELSKVELNKLYTFMLINPEVNIMICGHTDDVGSEEYNMTLSQNRARSVYSFLVDLGIDPARLKYQGFGKSQPVSDNSTEEGRALNRRTEVLIL